MRAVSFHIAHVGCIVDPVRYSNVEGFVNPILMRNRLNEQIAAMKERVKKEKIVLEFENEDDSASDDEREVGPSVYESTVSSGVTRHVRQHPDDAAIQLEEWRQVDVRRHERNQAAASSLFHHAFADSEAANKRTRAKKD